MNSRPLSYYWENPKNLTYNGKRLLRRNICKYDDFEFETDKHLDITPETIIVLYDNPTIVENELNIKDIITKNKLIYYIFNQGVKYVIYNYKKQISEYDRIILDVDSRCYKLLSYNNNTISISDKLQTPLGETTDYREEMFNIENIMDVTNFNENIRSITIAFFIYSSILKETNDVFDIDLQKYCNKSYYMHNIMKYDKHGIFYYNDYENSNEKIIHAIVNNMCKEELLDNELPKHYIETIDKCSLYYSIFDCPKIDSFDSNITAYINKLIDQSNSILIPACSSVHSIMNILSKDFIQSLYNKEITIVKDAIVDDKEIFRTSKYYSSLFDIDIKIDTEPILFSYPQKEYDLILLLRPLSLYDRNLNTEYIIKSANYLEKNGVLAVITPTKNISNWTYSGIDNKKLLNSINITKINNFINDYFAYSIIEIKKTNSDSIEIIDHFDLKNQIIDNYSIKTSKELLYSPWINTNDEDNMIKMSDLFDITCKIMAGVWSDEKNDAEYEEQECQLHELYTPDDETTSISIVIVNIDTKEKSPRVLPMDECLEEYFQAEVYLDPPGVNCNRRILIKTKKMITSTLNDFKEYIKYISSFYILPYLNCTNLDEKISSNVCDLLIPAPKKVTRLIPIIEKIQTLINEIKIDNYQFHTQVDLCKPICDIKDNRIRDLHYNVLNLPKVSQNDMIRLLYKKVNAYEGLSKKMIESLGEQNDFENTYKTYIEYTLKQPRYLDEINALINNNTQLIINYKKLEKSLFDPHLNIKINTNDTEIIKQYEMLLESINNLFGNKVPE